MGINEAVANSWVGRYFKIKERDAVFTTELRAGLVTFLTMAYILAVNSGILRDSGGPCTDSDCSDPGPGCRFNPNDQGYQDCLLKFRNSIIAATTISSCAMTLLMGVTANMPLALAPGMGINAYFTYNVVGYLGTGQVSYSTALAAVFVEGAIFFLLAVTGARSYFVRIVPKTIMYATSGGIGLFLAFIGLQTSNGVGLVSFEPATLVTLGGCPLVDRAPMYIIQNATKEAVCTVVDGVLESANLGPASPNYSCLSNRMQSATMWLGVGSFILIAVLLTKRLSGAIIIGIMLTTFISWIPDLPTSYLSNTGQIAGGEIRFQYFKQVVDIPDPSFTTAQFSFSALATPDVWIALATFLYLDALDTVGTMFSMSAFINQAIPGFLDPVTKSFPGQTWAFAIDGLATMFGSVLGTSPVTTYIESAAGIREGGRTGLTSVSTSFFFFIALWFAPIIASIPPYATGPALVIVGAMMVENLMNIDWADVRHAVPAFLTLAVMPFTYSIAYGLVAGLGSYLAIYLLVLLLDLFLSLFPGQKSAKEVLREAVPESWQKSTAQLVEEEMKAAENAERMVVTTS